MTVPYDGVVYYDMYRTNFVGRTASCYIVCKILNLNFQLLGLSSCLDFEFLVEVTRNNQ